MSHYNWFPHTNMYEVELEKEFCVTILLHQTKPMKWFRGNWFKTFEIAQSFLNWHPLTHTHTLNALLSFKMKLVNCLLLKPLEKGTKVKKTAEHWAHYWNYYIWNCFAEEFVADGVLCWAAHYHRLEYVHHFAALRRHSEQCSLNTP